MSEPTAARKAKQQFLKEQLRVNDWAAEELSEFLGSRRRNGLEIDAWTLDELAEEVRRFATQKRAAALGASARQSAVEETHANFFESARGERSAPRLSVVATSDARAGDAIQLLAMPENRVLTRTLADVYALRTRLRLEFPLCYVPPARAADRKHAFARRFFDRLDELRLADESESLRAFLDDARWAKLRRVGERGLPQLLVERLRGLAVDRPEALARNAAAHDELLGAAMPAFDDAKDKIEHFLPISRAMESLCQTNGRLFSQMKHKCCELSAALERVAALVDELVRLHSAHANENASFALKAGIAFPSEIAASNARLETALKEWAIRVRVEKSHVVDDLANHFHFRKHEYASFEELAAAVGRAQEDFRRRWTELEERKRALFAAKNVEKWRLKAGTVDVSALGDFAAVRPYMLSEETLALLDQFGFQLYIGKQLLYQFLRFVPSAQRCTEIAFRDFATAVRQRADEGTLRSFCFGRNSSPDFVQSAMIQSLV